MLQLEVVDRLAAQPGTKDWGRLGVMAQFQCQVEKLFEVPPDAFYPLQRSSRRYTACPPRISQFPGADKTALSKVVTQAFSQRRKTLRNNFKGVLTDADFEQIGIDPSYRAEALSISDFVAVTEHLGE